jgi:membrane-bound metal-dependent hydrolase YbcI (DUF457 family)
MMAFSHAPSGAAVWLPLAAASGVPAGTNLACAAVAAVAALLPDLDHPSAFLARAIPGGGVLARVVAGVTGGHRRGTHTIVAALIVGMVCTALAAGTPWAAARTAAAAVFVGYLVHIVGDCLTYGGCPVFLPFSRRRFSARLFRTGSTFETLIVAPTFGAIVVWQAYGPATVVGQALFNVVLGTLVAA